MAFWSSELMHQRVPAEQLIDPFATARVVNGAYELSLGHEVFVTSAETETKRAVEAGEQVVIPSGQFANLLTQEVVTVPADALGLISVKFRLKQRGLVNVSGFHVDPGYSSQLVFSVYNAGTRPVVLTSGDPAFLLWYASLDQPTADLYKARREGGITAEEVMHLQGEIATPQALAGRMDEFERALNGRVDDIERRLNRWSSVWGSVWKPAVGAVVGIVIAGLIAWAAGLFDRESDMQNEEQTTTTVTASTTTVTDQQNEEQTTTTVTTSTTTVMDQSTTTSTSP